MKYLSNRNILLLGVLLCIIVSILGIQYTQDSYQLLVDSDISLSSTSGLVLFFGSIVAIIKGIVVGGLVSGISIMIKNLLVNYGLKLSDNIKFVFTLIILILLSVLSVLVIQKQNNVKLLNQGIDQKAEVEALKIGIKLNSIQSGEISDDDIIYGIIPKLKKEKEQYFDGPFENEPKHFERNNRKMKIDFNGGIKVFENEKQIIEFYGNRYYPYMSTLSYTVFITKPNKSYLCIFINLRATSHLSLFVIFDQDGNKVYEMLMNRPS